MDKFSNQYNFRVDNQLKVVNALLGGQQSLNYLADKLGVSFTAISKIVNQLVDFKVLKKVKTKSVSPRKGRKPVLVKLNTHVGLTCAIDLSSPNLIITLNKLTGKPFIQRVIPDQTFLTTKTFEMIAQNIKEMLNEDEEKRKLLDICIACPGMVLKNSGTVVESSRFIGQKNINISNFFFNEFNVPVYVYNDVKVAVLGEKEYGVIPKNAKNYCFLHVGSSAGAALVFNGKLYQGKNGFSGEFTSYPESETASFPDRNRIDGLWFMSVKISEEDPTMSIKKDVFNVDLNAAMQYYEAYNPVFMKWLEECAKQNALQILAYNDFLDLEYFVIEGSMLKFKEKYKEFLLKHIGIHSVRNFTAKIIFSELEGQSSLYGAICQANKLYFMDRLEMITNERSSEGGYDISESFNDEI